MSDEEENPLRADHRVIRVVTGDAEAPWPGALAADPDGGTVLVVDAARFGASWPGWSAEPLGHVLGPLDVRRRADGHDLVLPLCTERVTAFLTRRAVDAPLTAGEGVTLAVSLLRGLAEVGEAAAATRGTWWLTDQGRPVLAADAGDTSCADDTAAHLRSLAEAVPALHVPVSEAAAIDVRRVGREIERIEAALFAVAEPAPLATATFGPRRAHPARTSADGAVDASIAPEPGLLHTLVRHVDADWADLLSRTTTGAWRAWRSRSRTTRRPLLVAAGAAVVVVVGGLLWPTGSPGPATAESAVAERTASATPLAPATPAPSAATEPAAEPVPPGEEPTLDAIASDLLSARSACAGDVGCLTGILETPTLVFPPGAADLPAAERTLTLLDEFGGAAVLRTEAPGQGLPAQLVVIVRVQDTWVIRDVYDITG